MFLFFCCCFFRDSDQQVLGFQTTKELLYGGFWQKEHSFTPSPSHPSPSPPHVKSHMFSITLLLDASVSRFSSLTRCVEAIRGVWPTEAKTTPLDARADFIKHFYYEVHITDKVCVCLIQLLPSPSPLHALINCTIHVCTCTCRKA